MVLHVRWWYYNKFGGADRMLNGPQMLYRLKYMVYEHHIISVAEQHAKWLFKHIERHTIGHHL